MKIFSGFKKAKLEDDCFRVDHWAKKLKMKNVVVLLSKYL